MNNLLEVKNISKNFYLPSQKLFEKKTLIEAVKDVSFDIKKGQTFGLVGESGSGKSTIAKCLLGLYRDMSGQIFFEGKDIFSLYKDPGYQREVQVVFQDPYSSLNPMLTVEEIITEPLELIDKPFDQSDIIDLLERVELEGNLINRYPHELSGGQRQRVSIARAISTSPKFIILDEAISALDVSIQAKIVKLLKQIQKEEHLTYLFIAHDLEMVHYISDLVGVMYNGRIVEYGEATKIYKNPLHPYTQHLLSSILPPIPDNGARLRQTSPYLHIQNKKDEDLKWEKIADNHYVLT